MKGLVQWEKCNFYITSVLTLLHCKKQLVGLTYFDLFVQVLHRFFKVNFKVKLTLKKRVKKLYQKSKYIFLMKMCTKLAQIRQKMK